MKNITKNPINLNIFEEAQIAIEIDTKVYQLIILYFIHLKPHPCQ